MKVPGPPRGGALAGASGSSAGGSSCQPLHSSSRRVGRIVGWRPHNQLHVNSIRSWICWQPPSLNWYLVLRGMVRFLSPVPAAAALGCSRLFGGNFSVGVNLLHLGMSNIPFSDHFDQRQWGSSGFSSQTPENAAFDPTAAIPKPSDLIRGRRAPVVFFGFGSAQDTSGAAFPGSPRSIVSNDPENLPVISALCLDCTPTSPGISSRTSNEE